MKHSAQCLVPSNLAVISMVVVISTGYINSKAPTGSDHLFSRYLLSTYYVPGTVLALQMKHRNLGPNEDRRHSIGDRK